NIFTDHLTADPQFRIGLSLLVNQRFCLIVQWKAFYCRPQQDIGIDKGLTVRHRRTNRHDGKKNYYRWGQDQISVSRTALEIPPESTDGPPAPVDDVPTPLVPLALVDPPT